MIRKAVIVQAQSSNIPLIFEIEEEPPRGVFLHISRLRDLWDSGGRHIFLDHKAIQEIIDVLSDIIK